METRASPNPGSNTKQSAHMDALSLMHSRIPIKGNYREPEYEELVKKAASILYDSYFDRTTKNRQVTAYASCCKVWGEKRLLRNKNHLESSMEEAGPSKPITITSKRDLLEHIVGDRPTCEAEVWAVQFPRSVVQCTLFTTSQGFLIYQVH
jgi:hypothetical protein